MRARPLSHIPPGARLLLAGALVLQLAWHAAQPRPPAQARGLPPPPSAAALQLASLGEPVALSRLTLLYLQSLDDQPGVALRFDQLDYHTLRTWLERILELDPRAQGPLLAASQVYGASGDPARARLMLDFVYQRFGEDPDRRWPWLAHAALAAKHRLHDLPLALRYAEAIRARATGPGVPGWAGELAPLIAADMTELDDARTLAGALLHSGQVNDPRELRLLEQQLQDISSRPARP